MVGLAPAAHRSVDAPAMMNPDPSRDFDEQTRIQQREKKVSVVPETSGRENNGGRNEGGKAEAGAGGGVGAYAGGPPSGRQSDPAKNNGNNNIRGAKDNNGEVRGRGKVDLAAADAAASAAVLAGEAAAEAAVAARSQDERDQQTLRSLTTTMEHRSSSWAVFPSSVVEEPGRPNDRNAVEKEGGKKEGEEDGSPGGEQPATIRGWFRDWGVGGGKERAPSSVAAVDAAGPDVARPPPTREDKKETEEVEEEEQEEGERKEKKSFSKVTVGGVEEAQLAAAVAAGAAKAAEAALVSGAGEAGWGEAAPVRRASEPNNNEAPASDAATGQLEEDDASSPVIGESYNT